jgi:hypothetical protein
LFHEGAQDIQLINLAILPWWVAGFQAAEAKLRRSGDKQDVLAGVPFVIRRPCPLAGGGFGLVSGGVVFPELSKLLNQEDALGAPCLDTVIVALRGRALEGRSTASRDRRNAADRRYPSLRRHITVG